MNKVVRASVQVRLTIVSCIDLTHTLLVIIWVGNVSINQTQS